MSDHHDEQPTDVDTGLKDAPDENGAIDGGGTASRRQVGLGVMALVAAVSLVVGGAIGFQAARTSGFEPPRRPTEFTGPPTQLAIGESAETSTGAEVTVLTWQPGTPVGWPDPGPDYEPSRAIVKFCAAPGAWNYRVRQITPHFELVTESGSLVDAVFDNSMMPEELAGSRELVNSAECVTGSVIFQDPNSEGIAAVKAVRFTGYEQYEWDVSAIADGTQPAPEPNVTFGVAPDTEGGTAPI